MSCTECPLEKLKPGDLVVNAYIAGTGPLLRQFLRINCPKCPIGYRDFYASQAHAIPDDTSRFEATIDRIKGEVKDCIQKN